LQYEIIPAEIIFFLRYYGNSFCDRGERVLRRDIKKEDLKCFVIKRRKIKRKRK